jgi:hypothetical protein
LPTGRNGSSTNDQFTEIAMNKLLLAAALVVAFAAPALAVGKAQNGRDHRQARSAYEHQAPLPKGSMNSAQGQPADSDWTQCDYMTYSDDNGCR